jgi:hypothetical protein
VVIKPAELTPLTALAAAELAVRAGIPAGVLNVLTADSANSIAIGKVLWVERKAVIYDREHDVVTPAVFDRVYIVPGKSALIIDYKTAGNGSDESLKKAYESQMINYREAIAKLTGLSPDKISCKLIGIFKSRVSVVDVF